MHRDSVTEKASIPTLTAASITVIGTATRCLAAAPFTIVTVRSSTTESGRTTCSKDVECCTARLATGSSTRDSSKPEKWKATERCYSTTATHTQASSNPTALTAAAE